MTRTLPAMPDASKPTSRPLPLAGRHRARRCPGVSLLRGGAALTLGALLTACAGAVGDTYRPVAPSARSDESLAAEAAARRAAAATDRAVVAARRLMVPVAGVTPDEVKDTFHAARGGGRSHRAADIFAPRGTPVVSADDGRILRVGVGPVGGNYVLALDPSSQVVYYYAHLDAFAPTLAEGTLVRRGDAMGTVGTTGNAAGTPPHLHFQVMRLVSDRPAIDGVPVNPAGLFAEPGARRRRLGRD